VSVNLAAARTRDRILDATLVVLARHGVRKLSMSDVSDAAGVSRPTLYRYYATKDDLLRALAEHEQRRFDQGLAVALTRRRAARDRLAAALAYMVQFLDEHPGRTVVDVEPAFTLQHLADALPRHAAALERSVGDALAASPAVRSGACTARDLADVLVRVAISEFLIPHPDPDALLRTLLALAGLRSRSAA
jgi:AcrR family transcriptional regulator